MPMMPIMIVHSIVTIQPIHSIQIKHTIQSIISSIKIVCIIVWIV